MTYPGSPPVAELHVLGDQAGLAQCLELVQSVCAGLGLSQDDAQAVHLAVEEACSNIVQHAYRDRPPGRMDLSFSLPEPDLLQAEIGDEAAPFRPEQAPEPDLMAELEDRPIGGLGWFLIRQMTTEIGYVSTPQGNSLQLRRRLASPVRAASGGV